MSTRHPIVVVGPMPPPLNGFSYVTQQMAALIAETSPVECIDLSPHLEARGIGYHAVRLWLVMRALARLLGRPRDPGRVVYIGCDGGFGLAYTVAMSLLARVLGYSLYIHHHSYAYINAWRVLMAMLLAAAGPRATHICLCETMVSALSRRYGRALNTAIVANAAFVPPQTEIVPRRAGPLRVGLLSNLDNSKGLDVFLDLVRRAVTREFDVTAVLAGPAASEGARQAIEAARAEMGLRLDYRGAVDGLAKQQFFSDIDVFVFPTCYRNEAQPMVVFEAFSYGVPVLTFDRGCIRAQVGTSGEALPQDADFVAFALGWLQQCLADRNEFVRRRHEIQAIYAEQNRWARRAAISVFDAGPGARPGTP